VDIAELKQKSVAELHTLAEQLNITNYSGLRKQDLIFRIEQSLLDSDTVIRGEGVLEILPEGYGFLRSQDWNYLYGPDDIYVSPSQIKRFDLRTGDTVMGQVRPPKEGERYLALLKVEQVNFEEPEKTKHRIAFDNLRPRYPDARIRLERKTGDLSMRVVDPTRQGSARADRGSAQGRQDHPDAEAGQCDQREPSRDRPDRPAHRRATRRGHGHGGKRQGRGDLLHL
jgi:transcription termination factor Rho